MDGGNLNLDLSLDTTLEYENNERWLKDGSIITSYNKNINENYKECQNLQRNAAKYEQIQKTYNLYKDKN